MTGIETHRSMVKAWECDSFGHFTVAYYFDRFADASATLLEMLAAARGLRTAGRGFRPSIMPASSRSCAAARCCTSRAA